MKKYSSVMSDLNEELGYLENQILICEDSELLSAFHNLQEFLLQNANHESSSPAQEILCWEMLRTLREKKQNVNEEMQQVNQEINQLSEKEFFPGFKQYMSAISSIAPKDAKTILHLLCILNSAKM